MTKTISADRCIYCDISGEARTDEHIIPKSIGGRLILPTATCVACQNKINKEIEDPLFGNQYVVLRDLYGLKKKDKNRDNAKYLNNRPIKTLFPLLDCIISPHLNVILRCLFLVTHLFYGSIAMQIHFL